MNHFPLPLNSGRARSFGRVGLAATAAAALAFGLAAPAAADPVSAYEDPVHAQYNGTKVQSGESVTMDGSNIGTSLFQLELDGGDTLTTYCIDFETQIRSGANYLEDDWANYPGQGDFAEPGKVFWILQNGYPNVSAADLEAAAKEAGENGINRVTEEQALGATQAAIWHFSNDKDLDSDNHPNVRGVYNYLIGAAEDLPQPEKPDTQLSVSPDSASGEAGQTIGEFTVETNVEEVPVSLDAPEGVELVDLDSGEAVENVTDGSTVGFAVPEDTEPGDASFSVSASTSVQQGRLFKGDENEEPTQTLITTEESSVSVSASASVEWSESTTPEEPEESEEPEVPEESDEPSDEPEDEKPAPEDEKDDGSELPVTGGALAGLVAAGVAALGAGAGALYLSRKRKANGVEDEA